MSQFGFSDWVNIEADVVEILVIEDIAAVENKGGFAHGEFNKNPSRLIFKH